MADTPTCAQCGSPCSKGRALCSPCAKELAEKADAARKRREGR